jgi:hypothetical protein
MRFGRNGVIDLPVKLMVILLIIAISVPLLTSAMERGEANNASYAMNSEIDRIFNAVAAVHYSGIGSSRTISVAIPDGCEIVMPGGDDENGYVVKMDFKGRETGVRYMDRPPVRLIADDLVITGNCLLLITSDTVGGDPAARVSAV